MYTPKQVHSPHQTLILSTTLLLAGFTFGYSGGTGEPNNPYQIADVNNLLELAADVNNYDKSFILIADINLDPAIPGNQTFTTAIIARDTNEIIEGFQGTSFTGTFDGAGHKISNLIIYNPAIDKYTEYCGLFGYISNAEVNNLILENFRITVGNFSTYIGGLAGRSEFTTINNIIVENFNTSDGYATYLGGLVGSNESGTISDCYSTSTINLEGSSHVGGLVGYNNYGTISDCCSISDISSGTGNYYTGGLVGGNTNGLINNCNSAGHIDLKGKMGPIGIAGGLAGYNERGTINNCFSTSSVYDSSNGVVQNLGGLVGSNGDVIINNCYSTGAVTGYIYIGGLVGMNWRDYSYSSISNCFSTGTVTGDNSIGGLVGRNDNFGNISFCYSTGSVIGRGGSGGLVGDNFYGCNISKCFSMSKVTSAFDSASLGGLVGTNSAVISECFSTGDVCGISLIQAGGLISYNSFGTISNCFSTGSVYGGTGQYIGGFIGYDYVGGTNNCYSSGTVTGGADVGGFLGYDFYDYGFFNSSFFLNTSGPDNGYGEPLPDANMKQRASFTDWDFVSGPNDIWTIKEDVNYPALVWSMINLTSHRFPFGWYEVDLRDFAMMANQWGRDDCADNNDCSKADFDFSGKMDLFDLKIFCNDWLEGMSTDN